MKKQNNKPIFFESLGYSLYLDDLDSLNLKGLNGIYDRDIINYIHYNLDKDSVCIDVGANIGYFTVMMAKHGVKEIHAFEPDVYNCKLLFNNIDLNNVRDNIKIYPRAISDHNCALPLYQCYDNHGMSRTYPSKWCDINKFSIVPASPIDDMLNELDSLKFVKIDVEGYEAKVLEGMWKTIRKFKPDIIMEFHIPSIIESNTIPEPALIFNYLKLVCGYDIYILNHSAGATYKTPDIDKSTPIDKFEEIETICTNTPGMSLLCR